MSREVEVRSEAATHTSFLLRWWWGNTRSSWHPNALWKQLLPFNKNLWSWDTIRLQHVTVMWNAERNITPTRKTKVSLVYYLPSEELNMPFANENAFLYVGVFDIYSWLLGQWSLPFLVPKKETATWQLPHSTVRFNSVVNQIKEDTLDSIYI